MVRDKFIRTQTARPPRVCRVQPDQSMTLDEIVRKFVRGIPVDVVRHQGVYVDSDLDLEAVSRMDFADKAAMAAELKESINEEVRRASERRKNEASEQASRSDEDKTSGPQAQPAVPSAKKENVS